MPLTLAPLTTNVEAAMQLGADGASRNEVADALTDAIVSYSSGAQILMLPGPITIPSGGATSSGQGATLLVTTSETGRSALKQGIRRQFSEEDPTLGIMAKAIQEYVNTSFTVFTATVGHTAAGTTVMASPPDLELVLAGGLAGNSLAESAALMAKLIHESYQISVFSGAGTAIDTGVGTVSGQKLF